MKDYLCYISQGMDADGTFEHRIRRATDAGEFFAICREYLDHAEPVPATSPTQSSLFCGWQALLETP